ncbi:MAG: hypothetical protein ACP5NX_03285 [Candidatus Bilamarchaeaceae archaeon]
MRIANLALSGKCFRYCDHCAIAMKPGPMFPFERIEPLLCKGAVREYVCVNYGEPLAYLDKGKTMADVLVLFNRHKVDCGLVTAGFARGNEFALEVIGGIATLPFPTRVELSINLHQEEYAEYREKVLYTLGTFIAHGIAPVLHPVAHPWELAKLEALVNEIIYLIPGTKTMDTADIGGGGRSREGMPGFYGKERDARTCGAETGEVTVMQNGDAFMCGNMFALTRTKPFANLFTDGLDGVEAKYDEMRRKIRAESGCGLCVRDAPETY